MWRSLFWKEWREQRWKAAFNTLLVTAFVAIGLRSRIWEDRGTLILASELAAFILPLFVSMGIVAAERSEGSTRFLFALPTKKSQLLEAKTLVGIFVVILPFLGGLMALVLISGSREMSSTDIILGTFAAIWMGIQSFVWYLVFGIRQPNEARAGVAAALVWGVWWLHMLCIYIYVPDGPPSLEWRIIYSFVPFGIIVSRFETTPFLQWILIPAFQLFILTVLLLCGYFRFSRERGRAR